MAYSNRAAPPVQLHAPEAAALSKAASAPEVKSNARFAMELEHAMGFSGGVSGALAFHPNQNHYVSVAGGCLVIGNLKDPHDQAFLRGHDDRISCLAVSPSFSLLASGQVGHNADVVVWDFKSRKELFRFSEHVHGIASIDFSDDERFLVTVGDAQDKKMFIWDLKTGNIVGSSAVGLTTSVRWGGRVKDIKNRPTTQYQLATVCGNLQQVIIWTLDPATGAFSAEKCKSGQIQRNHTCCEFSADGEFLFVGSESGDVSIYHSRSKVLLQVLPACSNGVLSIFVAPTEEIYVGGGDGSVTVFSVVIGKKREYVEKNKGKLHGGVSSMAFSNPSFFGTNDQDAIFLAGTSTGNIFLVSTRDLKASLVGESHSAEIVSVAFPLKSSDRFTTVSADGAVRVWDTSDYNVRMHTRMNGMKPACVAYCDECIIVGCADGFIRTFDPVTGDELWSIANAHKDGVTCLQLSRNQKFLVSAGFYGEIRVWEIRTRELICTLKEHLQSVTGLALLEDNRHVLSCSKDRGFICWDLQTEKRISAHKQNMGGLNTIALIPQGDRYLAVTAGQEKSITIWDLSQPNALKVIAPAHEGEVTCIAVSHNGQVFASGGHDQVVRLWDSSTMKCIASGIGHSASVNSLQFSWDDNQLVSVGRDDCIFVWNIYNLSK